MSFWDSPDTGLKENFDGTISGETRWEQYEGGNYSLNLWIAADDGTSLPIRGLGVGKNWVSYDGGESIQPLAKPKFHEKSGIWKWISACSKVGAAEVLQKANEELGGDNTRLYAASFSGLRFHFDVVQEEGAIRQDDGSFKTGLREVIRPTAFLGSEDVSPSSRGNAMTAQNGNSIECALKPVALQAASYEEFADLAMEAIEKIPQDQRKNAYVQIADKAYYETLRG